MTTTGDEGVGVGGIVTEREDRAEDETDDKDEPTYCVCVLVCVCVRPSVFVVCIGAVCVVLGAELIDKADRERDRGSSSEECVCDCVCECVCDCVCDCV